MKKILILFLLTASLGFSANYKVEVKPNVKIQQLEIEKNNVGIEKAFEKFVEKQKAAGIREAELTTQSSQRLGIALTDGMAKQLVYDTQYSIKKIEYISSDIVNLDIEIKIPELDSRNFSEDEMMRVVSKRFKEKTGKPIEILKTTPKKNIKPEWVSTLFQLMSDFTIEKVKTTKIFTYQNATISLKKVNNEWIFHKIVKQ
ncbi:hypothetical protein [Leptotrichia massiliensis]|uniref:hypothetical protein n=1 Tax=Leptotrichia massiliensis TaxID=1852388 RepID=UPI0028D729EF|nr:hypothetical protein [Leptotrichia massiliensis]